MKDSQSDIIELCNKLNEATKLKRNGKSIKLTNFVSNTQIKLDSWKFLEWDYGKPSVQLPIQARGLFTLNNDTIAVRGYDKFFNVEEKPFTKETDLKTSTHGPYEVTLKENGCIIFISGLSTGDIVVCSKHSTGDRIDDNESDKTTTATATATAPTRNHAKQGEFELLQQFDGDQQKVKQLAHYLYENNLTVVAELCDDEFEEHVLPYPKDKSGLYVHGLNYNTITFKTLPMEQVLQFAKEWGFKYVSYLTYDNADELFKFLHKCSETGTYNGREIEGFVIRCHRQLHTNGDTDGDCFFFKYKFEQPYLLYRQFREVTKQLLNGTPINSIKIKKNKPITKKYLQFVEKLFEQEPEIARNFENGFDIIKVRQLFLQSLNETNGMNLLSIDSELSDQLKNLALANGNEGLSTTTKYIFVPIATIGCGKTTVFNTLNNLFPQWTHIQNDNISKKAKLKICDLTLLALEDDDQSVVLFDRNNSASRERRQIFTTIDQKRDEHLDDTVDLKYIAINFIPEDLSEEELWDITYNRVIQRGDNHQSIKSQLDENLVESVMKGFIQRYQPINTSRSPDDQFDHVIHLKLSKDENSLKSSLENVRIIIDDLVQNFPDLIKEKPADELINECFQKALDYKPTFVKNMTANTIKKDPTYYGIAMHYSSILENLEIVSHNEHFQNIKSHIQTEFHVTLGHIASSKQDKAGRVKWKKLVKTLGKGDPNKPKSALKFFADVKLLQIVINTDKLACIKVEILKIYDTNDVLQSEIEPINKQLHITIGCIPPATAVESNMTLEELYDNPDKQELKPDGTYKCGDDTLHVFNFDNPDLKLFSQQLFVAYQ